MSAAVCRWGILGTAGIARKNWQAIRLADNATLVAVASRSVERSTQFIAECQAQVPFETPPTALGSYDELLNRSDIDAVYIPLPTGLRRDWVIKAAEAGKHVLVEKPVGVSTADVELMLAACRRHNVQFMDGVMFMHSQRLPAIRAALDTDAAIGRLRRIGTHFSFQAPEDFLQGNIRVSSELEPHGCLGDLGWYTIRFCLWAMNYQLPTHVTARQLASFGRADSPRPVPLEFSAELFFPAGVSAGFYCSFQTEHQQWVHLSGSKGSLRVADFVLPYFGAESRFEITNSAFEVNGCRFDMEERSREVKTLEHSNNHPTAQECRMIQTFSQNVLTGNIDPHWGEIALKTQQVLDACYESALNDGRPVALPA